MAKGRKRKWASGHAASRKDLAWRVSAAGLVALGLTWLLVATSHAAAGSKLLDNFPAHYYAPYVDMTASPTQSLVGDSRRSGVRYFSLAFVEDDGATGSCVAAWGGVVPLDKLGVYLPGLDSDIASLRSLGGDVVISFGGGVGSELATTCRSVSALEKQYQSVLDHYLVSHVDFDIEGSALTDMASIDRRNKALNALEHANPGLKVSYTLPVLPSGLTGADLALLRNAAANDVEVNVVNVMTMDYGTAFSTSMGRDAVQAGRAVIGQLRHLHPGKPRAQIAAMVGITPLSGVNDVPGETFTLADARMLARFAHEAGIGELGMWSVARDEPGFGYSKALEAFARPS